jgi:acetolactate synthase-1/2/3 large subunit
VWSDRAEDAARRAAETMGLPTITNGMGRGVLPAGHPLLVTRARSRAFAAADLVLVVGAPLDFRLGYGEFAGGAAVCQLTDAPAELASHVDLAGSASGDLTLTLDGLVEAWQRRAGRASYADWTAELRAAADAAIAADVSIMDSDAEPIHPARVYRELNRQLSDDTVVIGDGGDFVSYAGKFVEPRRPGCWLDPGPYGCLGTGLGYAIAARIARPSAPVVLMLGDGAAGFSLMDVDTLVRHDLPVVMIVGNNGIWGLEKHPMRFLYGYDVAADLRPHTRYDEVVRALGGAGELVTKPADLAAAIGRALDSGVPYLINVSTDPAVAYPRSTTGI